LLPDPVSVRLETWTVEAAPSAIQGDSMNCVMGW
jgi:hypothetical protein